MKASFEGSIRYMRRGGSVREARREERGDSVFTIVANKLSRDFGGAKIGTEVAFARRFRMGEPRGAPLSTIGLAGYQLSR